MHRGLVPVLNTVLNLSDVSIAEESLAYSHTQAGEQTAQNQAQAIEGCYN